MKVTAIEEAQDISNIKVDELIGSLQTFEMSLNDKSDKKKKSIAFVSNAEEDEEKSSKGRGVQCLECEGYGHIKSECPTFLKKQGKGMMVTWSDEDSEGDKTRNQVLGLTVKYNSETESSDGEISEEELAETYKLLFKKWQEACDYGKKLERTVKGLENEKHNLLDINNNLQEEVSVLKSKLEGMIKSVRMLNNGTDMFDLMLETGKTAKDMKGLGYESDSAPEESKKITRKFVPAERKTEFKMSNQMPQHCVKHVYQQIPYTYPQGKKAKNLSWRCHHCGRYGHIRPYCYRLYGFPHQHDQPRTNSHVQARKEWKPRGLKEKKIVKAPSHFPRTNKDVAAVLNKKEGKKENLHTQTRSLKWKKVSVNDSETNVEPDVQNIVPTARKQISGKGIPVNVPPAPLDNVSFHPEANVQTWKSVCQEKVGCEKECSQEAMKCKDIMEFLADVGLS